MAEEAMRHERLLGEARPRRDHVQIPVDLHRVAIDHDPMKALRHPDRQCRLAGSRRTCDQDRAGQGGAPRFGTARRLWRGLAGKLVSHVLVLVSAVKRRALSPALLQASLGLLDANVPPRWLHEGVSAEVPLPRLSPSEADALLARLR